MGRFTLIIANVAVLILIVTSLGFFYSQINSSKDTINSSGSHSEASNVDGYDYLTTTKLSMLEPLQPTTYIKPTGNVKEFTLEAKVANWEIMPGVEVKAVAYNGIVPGPTIEVTEGDLVRVTIKNSLQEDTSIHWHGLHLPNKEDGVPDVTQEAIKPGESYTYEFLAGHAGTYMYHPHINSVEQIDNGLYAPFIIHPQNPKQEPVFDKDHTFIFGGWNVSQGDIDRKKMLEAMRLSKAHGAKSHDGMDMDENHSDDAGMSMGGMDYNFWTINGKAFPFTQEIKVKEGDRVRIRLINMSNANHPMHLHGTDFRIIAEDSHPLKDPKIVNTVDVAPGKTFDIEFLADNPGNWIFHCHELHHTENDGVEPGGIISLITYDTKSSELKTNQKGHSSPSH